MLLRSTNIEGKAEDFWKQGDFGYVKKEMDSLTTLCKPQVKVGGMGSSSYSGYCKLSILSQNYIHGLLVNRARGVICPIIMTIQLCSTVSYLGGTVTIM